MIGTVLTWTAPTQLANGDPLPANFITGYRIYRGATALALSAVLDVGATPTEVAFSSITGTNLGQWFAVSALSPLGESVQTAAEQLTAFFTVPAYTMPSFTRM